MATLTQPPMLDQRPMSSGHDQRQAAAPLNLPPVNYSSPLPLDQGQTSAFATGPPPFRLSQPSPYMPSPAYTSHLPSYQFFPSAHDDKMGRTVSHAHPMESAGYTASSRFSSSPHSATGIDMAPPSAGANYTWYASTPSFSLNDNDKHINPNMLSYPMSRSTSGASGVSDADQRLMTPHLEYSEHLSPGIQDVRKVSDSHRPFSKYESAPYLAPPGAQVYAQPGMAFWGRNDNQAMAMIPENDYERARQEQISGNKKLLEDLGLGHAAFPRERHSSSSMRRKATPKRRLQHDPVRSSPRIASIHRSLSYADLDGNVESDGSDSYSDSASYEEEDYRPVKRGRGQKGGRKMQQRRKPADLSLWGLLQVYPQIIDLFPLFYYTLNNDLSINSDSVPLIGSIPPSSTPVQKAELLRTFFHRGRRVLLQLDTFTSRCDRKYEGPEERWPELEHHTRIAIRDIRRKIVERCENYKYTRRDILDKKLGKNQWQPIEHGMIEWRLNVTPGDPAGDISNVTLTLPTPPAHIVAQQQQQQQLQQQHMQQQHYGQLSAPGRTIRPMPSRARLASARNMSANMDTGEYTTTPLALGSAPPLAPMTAHTGVSASYPYSSVHMSYSAAESHSATPMYGEDRVPMSVQMPQLDSTQAPADTPLVPLMPLTSIEGSSPAEEPLVAVGSQNDYAKVEASVEQWTAPLVQGEEYKRESSETAQSQ